MSGMVRKHRPKKLSDLKGNPSKHAELKALIERNSRILLTGSSGIGKTEAVYIIAEELGRKVIEYNASDERTLDDFKDVARKCQMYSAIGQDLIYLLDEIEGADFRAWTALKEILTYSRYAVVMTTNDAYKVTKIKTIKDLYITVKLRQPYITTVVDVAKDITEKEGLRNVDFSNIKKRDMRNAINVAMYGGESYDEYSPFTSTTEFFTKGNLKNIAIKDSAWLFDNAPEFLFGADLYKFYELLEIASRSDIGVMSCCPKGRGTFAKYPTYYRRRSTTDDEDDKT